MKPYYDHAGIQIYHGDCRDVLAELPALPGSDLILADPPYGIDYRSTHNSGWRSNGTSALYRREQNFRGILGDKEPLDPAHLLIGGKVAIFGGNYCANKLPPAECWIVWDKNCGKTRSNQADCELVWTNFERPSRVFQHLWRGIMRAGEENVSNGPKLHPHQKPLALLRYIIEYADLASTSTVLDPYCGSGSTLLAAAQLGHKAIGIELDEKYCEVAADRISRTPIQPGVLNETT